MKLGKSAQGDILLVDDGDQIFLHHTGNMFGMGCSAFSDKAIDRINLLKKREGKAGLIILLAEPAWMEKYDLEVLPEYKNVLDRFWPGNLTVIAKDSKKLFSKVAPNGTVACRVPSSSALQEFIHKIGKPITSTSVNIAGEEPHNNYKRIISKYKDWFDFVVWEQFIELDEAKASTIIDLTKPELHCIREGSIPFYKIKKTISNPMILFICTGNTCRSPMAEYYARSVAEKLNLSYEIRSSGFVLDGHPISINSSIVLQKEGIDGRQHVSSIVDAELLSKSFLVLTMSNKHRLNILERFPEAKYKTHLFSKFCGENFCEPGCNIADPHGYDIGHYQKTFVQIKERVNKLFEILSIS